MHRDPDSGKSRDARAFTRIQIAIVAEILVDGRLTICDEIRDLSVRGVFAYCDDAPPVGTECDVALRFEETPHSLHAMARGIVVRVADGGMAIEFTAVDPENFHHLKNLVLYNATEPEQVEAELSEHLGLKPRC